MELDNHRFTQAEFERWFSSEQAYREDLFVLGWPGGFRSRRSDLTRTILAAQFLCRSRFSSPMRHPDSGESSRITALNDSQTLFQMAVVDSCLARTLSPASQECHYNFSRRFQAVEWTGPDLRSKKCLHGQGRPVRKR